MNEEANNEAQVRARLMAAKAELSKLRAVMTPDELERAEGTPLK